MKTIKFIIGVFLFLFEDFVRFVKEKMTKLRYKIELGGKNGLRVTGLWRYPGRFQSKDQIIDLCLNLKPNKNISIAVRWKENDFYSHQFEILANETSGFDIDLLEAYSQSYLYLKTVKREQLNSIIFTIEDQCDNPKENGFKLEYF
jgi:hypothetical protein